MASIKDTILIGHGFRGQAGGADYTTPAYHSMGGWGTHAQDRIRIDPTAPHLAFLEANARLPAEGGDLFVSSGSATYNFPDIGALTKPARIVFDRGVIISKSTNNRTCLTSTASLEIHGGVFQAAIDSTAPPGQSFVELLGTGSGDDAAESRFVGCTFRPLQNANNVQNFFCIRGRGHVADQTRTLFLSRCHYQVRAGTTNAWAWVGEETSGQGTNEYTGEPYGCGFLRVEDFRGVSLEGIHIIGKAPTGNQVAGTILLLDDCNAVDINGFTAINFSNQATTGVDHASPVIMVRSTASEGHHMTVRGINAENLSVKHLLSSNDPRWVTISGLEMGRGLGTLQESTLHFRGGAGSESVSILGCGSHNVTGPTGLGNLFCDIEDVANVLVATNRATFRQDANNPFRVHNCANTLVRDNLYQAE